MKVQMEHAVTGSFLDDALKLVREVIDLRQRFACAQREHAELLAQRETSLSEGIDLLPEIRSLHLEIERLPAEIASLEERVQCLVDQGVEKLNAENSKIAAERYIKNRDSLRKVLEPFREALASILQNIETSGGLGPSSTEVHNVRLGEIEKLLGNAHFSRVAYRMLCLPPLDHELVRQNQLLAALDRWIGGLR